MTSKILLYIDWNRGVWAMQYRNSAGDMIAELTGFPANTPSIVVCDAMRQARPQSRVFAKLG